MQIFVKALKCISWCTHLKESLGEKIMAKFKCIHTGNEFTFNDVDSVEMRKHVEYVEVLIEELVPIVLAKVKVSHKKENK